MGRKLVWLNREANRRVVHKSEELTRQETRILHIKESGFYFKFKERWAEQGGVKEVRGMGKTIIKNKES